MRRIAALVIAVLAAQALLAITVGEKEITCSICGTKNTITVLRSYGSYACLPEGELDLVPCPIVYTSSIWSCRQCRYTSYVDDAEVPAGKVSAVHRFLDSVPPGPYSPTMSDQLVIAEGVYRALGRDDEFWADFYRSAGFFATQEKEHEQARRWRAEALKAYERLLADPKRASYRKEDLLAAGAVAAKLGQDTLAREYLKKVPGAAWDQPDTDPEDLAAMDQLARRILESPEVTL